MEYTSYDLELCCRLCIEDILFSYLVLRLINYFKYIMKINKFIEFEIIFKVRLGHLRTQRRFYC